MRSDKVVNEYKIMHWSNTVALETVLNELTNDGWLVDNHHLDSGGAGWTIFRKSTWVNPPLLQRTIDLSTMYSIVNRVCQPELGGESAAIGREIDRQIKDAVRVEGDTF